MPGRPLMPPITAPIVTSPITVPECYFLNAETSACLLAIMLPIFSFRWWEKLRLVALKSVVIIEIKYKLKKILQFYLYNSNIKSSISSSKTWSVTSKSNSVRSSSNKCHLYSFSCNFYFIFLVIFLINDKNLLQITGLFRADPP